MNIKSSFLICFMSALTLILLVPFHPAWSDSSSCYLAAHDDVICPRGDAPSPGADIVTPLDFTPAVTSGAAPVFVNGSKPVATQTGGSGGSGSSDSGAGATTTSSGLQCNGSDPIGSAKALIKQREGNGSTAPPHIAYHAYIDSVGVPTICYGHKIIPGDGFNINSQSNEQDCEALFEKDFAPRLTIAQQEMQQAGICYGCFLPNLLSVIYQLGNGWTSVYGSWWNALKSGDYTGLVNLILASKTPYAGHPKGGWAGQTPARAQDFITAIKALPPKGTPCGNSAATGASGASVSK